MNIQKMKSNKGVTMADVIIAMFILSIFAGLIGQLYYRNAVATGQIYKNAEAVNYSIKIAEYIDKISYEEVTNQLNNTIVSTFAIKDDYDVSIVVSNYTDKNPEKEDILKTVLISISYTLYNEDYIYEIEKVKVKEF